MFDEDLTTPSSVFQPVLNKLERAGSCEDVKQDASKACESNHGKAVVSSVT